MTDLIHWIALMDEQSAFENDFHFGVWLPDRSLHSRVRSAGLGQSVHSQLVAHIRTFRLNATPAMDNSNWGNDEIGGRSATVQ
jgi:hypothetical protein